MEDREKDKVNIGLTQAANNAAEILERTNKFKDRLTLAKFALAYAIKQKLDEDLENFKMSDTLGTKWNIGSVDPDQYLRGLMVSLYPECATPYKYIEALMNRGLVYLEIINREQGITSISELM